MKDFYIILSNEKCKTFCNYQQLSEKLCIFPADALAKEALLSAVQWCSSLEIERQ
jgi:hypothetical protein